MFITNVPGEDLPLSVLVNGPVRTGDGKTIGKVHELIIDQHGHVTTALIDIGELTGCEEKIVAIPFGVLAIDAAEARTPSFVTQLSKEEFIRAPRFEWAEQSPLEQFKDQSVALGHIAAEKTSEIMQKVSEKASDVSERAIEKTSELGNTAAEKATELGQKATEKASKFGEIAGEKASEIGQKASEKASEIGQKVAEKTSELTRKVARNREGKDGSQKGSER